MPTSVAPGELATRQPLVDAKSIFLFLDFDGTLVEIAPRPSDVYLTHQRRQCLQDLLSTPGLSAAVVSGRPIEELKRLIQLDDLFYVGNHGLEWIAPRGRKNSCSIGKPVMDALQSLRDEFSHSIADLKGVFLEDKGTALALHFRLASEDTALNVKSEFVRAIHRQQKRGVALEILAGKEVVEAKPAAVNKGDATERLLERFDPEAFPVYIGDDITDEMMFQRFHKRGLTILVVGTPRPTAASFYLRNPNEVYEFLQRLVRIKTNNS